MISDTIQITAKLSSMPMKGGKCVKVLKIGTLSRPIKPSIKNNACCPGRTLSGGIDAPDTATSIVLGIMKVSTSKGTSRQMMLGNATCSMSCHGVNLPAIHSIVVVTSPIGVQAPPALAAMTTTPTKYGRHLGSGTTFRRIDTMTMVVVKLSNTDDMKKDNHEMLHSSLRASLDLM